MTTENNHEAQTEVSVQEETKVVEKQLSSIEQKALEQGWIPKEEFHGNEDDFIDAKEFVRRGELFSKIEHQSKELKAVRQALEAFKQHHSKVRESEYNRALKALQDAKKEALVEGEHDKFFALEEKIDEVKREKAEFVQEASKPVVQTETQHPEFQNWVQKNPWYEANRPMRAFADDLGRELASQGYTPTQVLKQVEIEIRKEFPQKFQNPKATRASGVEEPTRSGKSNKNDSFVLSDEERSIMRKIVSVTPGYTEADYIKELKRVKGV